MTAFCQNILQLRKIKKLTQEDVAEATGVTRQAVAKWESGESLPDVGKSHLLAKLFNVSLDDLVNYQKSNDKLSLPIPPKGKHFFGTVNVNEKGQIVIPEKARKLFNIKPKDSLVILGDLSQGLALMKVEDFLTFADFIRSTEKKEQSES